MVKTILKRNNILLSQFASDLNISRPTLDSYIKSYDKGIPLTNNLYQKIFDFLFTDITVSNEEFVKKYEYIVANYGTSGEIKSGGSSLTNTVLENIVNDGSIRSYLNNDELNSLGDLIVNKDSLLIHLMKIDLILSNKIKLDALSEKDKMLTVGMYELSCKLNSSDYSFNQEIYDNLEKAVIKKKEPATKDEIKQKLVDGLSKIIDEAIENGDVDSIAKLLQSLKQN